MPVERLDLDAQLIGGPMDGESIRIRADFDGRRQHVPDIVRVAVPPSRPSVASYGYEPDLADLAEPIAVAVYELRERSYIEPHDPFLPKRIMVAGRYHWKP